jgi:hypothetical protein
MASAHVLGIFQIKSRNISNLMENRQLHLFPLSIWAFLFNFIFLFIFNPTDQRAAADSYHHHRAFFSNTFYIYFRSWYTFFCGFMFLLSYFSPFSLHSHELSISPRELKIMRERKFSVSFINVVEADVSLFRTLIQVGCIFIFSPINETTCSNIWSKQESCLGYHFITKRPREWLQKN